MGLDNAPSRAELGTSVCIAQTPLSTRISGRLEENQSVVIWGVQYNSVRHASGTVLFSIHKGCLSVNKERVFSSTLLLLPLPSQLTTSTDHRFEAPRPLSHAFQTRTLSSLVDAPNTSSSRNGNSETSSPHPSLKATPLHSIPFHSLKLLQRLTSTPNQSHSANRSKWQCYQTSPNLAVSIKRSSTSDP